MFPLGTKEELNRLALDIKQNGQVNPCVKHGEQLVDGRNRILACRAAGIEPDFAQWDDWTLIKDDKFADTCIQHMEEDMAKGALGLKVTKELGLHFTDKDGKMISVDDERLFPIWERAGELDVPVLIHISDPVAFFQPSDPKNEHYPTLQDFPGWSFYGSHFTKWELLEQRNRMIAAHPNTNFILPHVANNPEDLESVSELLKRLPNIYIDFSARIDELGRQPYTARDFLIRYQDRVIYGTDLVPNETNVSGYYRFFETNDEYFPYNSWDEHHQGRWNIYGVYLPDEVLKKLYYKNALKVAPRLSALAHCDED
jgi:hypothetical protein